MARVCGLRAVTDGRICRVCELQIHRDETFKKLSRDPRFRQRVGDIVGLDLHAPERMVVVCVDKKSRVQALEILPNRRCRRARACRKSAQPATTGPEASRCPDPWRPATCLRNTADINGRLL